MKIPEIDFQPGQVSTSVAPVQQVDVTSSLRNKQIEEVNDMKQRLTEEKANARQRALNKQTEAFPMEKLMQFSNTLTSIVDAKAQEMDQDLQRKMTMLAWQDRNKPSESFEQKEAEAESQGEGLDQVSQAYAKETGDVEGASRIEQLSGRAKMHYGRAVVQLGAEQYPTFLRDNGTREFDINGQNVSMLTGNAEERAAIQTMLTEEYLEQYKGYNKDFLSKYMFPSMYKSADKEAEYWTKQANFRASQVKRESAPGEYRSGSIDFNSYLNKVTSTTNKDGSFYSYSQALDGVTDLFKTKQWGRSDLAKLGDTINPMTKKPWKESPRYSEWYGAIVDSELKVQSTNRKLQTNQAREYWNSIDYDDPAALAEGERYMIEELGIDKDIVYSTSSTARQNSDHKRRQREITDGVNRSDPEFVDPATGLIRDDVAYEMDYNTRQQFQQLLSPQAKGMTVQKDFLGGQGSKDLDKDIDGLIEATYSDAGITLKLENALTGQSGPPNQAAYETETKNWIVNYASELMVNPKAGSSPPPSMDAAIQIAKDTWRDLTTKTLRANPKGIFNNGQFVLKGSASINDNAVDRATFFTMHSALTEKDLESTGDYSPAVMQLSRRFSKTPEAIVRMARVTKGLEPTPVTPREASVAAIPETDQARLNSVTNPSVQSKLRAQLRANQALQGTPEQRAVAVGRQIESMGYKGIWQNKYFNYENGYTPTGGQRVWQRPYDSKHNSNQALDIGLGANTKEQLDSLAYYLNMNKKKFGIRLVLWQTEGHYDHVHVDFE